jgi:DnaK suppressor protein
MKSRHCLTWDECRRIITDMDRQTAKAIVDKLVVKARAMDAELRELEEALRVPEMTSGDEGDRAQHSSDMSLLAAKRARLVVERAKIGVAVVKFEQGSFGECSECGSDIDPKRLEANPVADLCILCQEELERDRRRTAQRGGE